MENKEYENEIERHKTNEQIEIEKLWDKIAELEYLVREHHEEIYRLKEEKKNGK